MTEPTVSLTFAKRGDADPVLILDGEDIPPEAEVTWPAKAWAALLYAYVKAAVDVVNMAIAEGGYKASPTLRMEVPGLLEMLNELRATRPDVQDVRVVAQSQRVTTTEIVRDGRGRPTGSVAVQEDVA